MADTVVQYVLRVDSKAAQKALDSTAKEADDLTKSLDKLGNESKDASKDLDKTEKSSKKTQGGLSKLSKAAKVSRVAIAGVGAVAVGAVATVGALATAYIAAGKAAFNFTREVVDSVNDLNDLSAQSALSAQSIQAVRLAFEGSGQSAESASAFISRFPRLMADLEAGTSRASESAKKLGLEITDASGQIKSSDQILRETIGSLQQIENDTERTTTAFLLLGRNAGQLLQAFAKTSNFENFLALSKEFGVKTGPEASAAAGQFQELLAALSVVIDGTKQALVEAVGGVGFFNEFLLKTLKLVAGVQVLLEQNKESINSFSTALVQIGGGVVDVFRSMLSGLENFIAEAVSFMVMKLTTPLFILNQIGAISDETFAKIENVGIATQKAGRALEEIAVGVQRTEEGAVSAGERVEELVKGILAGLTIESKKAQVPVDDLANAINGLGKTAEQSGEQDLDQNLLREARDQIFSIAKDFSVLSPEIRNAQDTVDILKSAIEELESQNKSTAFSNTLLVEAERRLAQARQDAARQAKQAKFDTAASVVGAVGGLDVAQLAGFINPALGAITGTLITLGEKSPDQIRDEALAQAEALKNGLAVLPELILSIIPHLAIAITEAIIDGFLMIFVNLKNLIVEAFNTAFSFRDRSPDGNDRARRRRRRRQTLLDFINPMESASFMGGGRFVPSAQGGIRFTGAQDGLAQLHRGEFVVPQSGQRPQQVDRQLNRTTGGGMTININSAVVDRNAVDALVREIEIRFNNQFGTSSSSLFGGR
jgi:hypothetical protein